MKNKTSFKAIKPCVKGVKCVETLKAFNMSAVGFSKAVPVTRSKTDESTPVAATQTHKEAKKAEAGCAAQTEKNKATDMKQHATRKVAA